MTPKCSKLCTTKYCLIVEVNKAKKNRFNLLKGYEFLTDVPSQPSQFFVFGSVIYGVV